MTGVSYENTGVSFGSYHGGDSLLHRTHPGVKFFSLVTVMLFAGGAETKASLIISLLFLLLTFGISKIPAYSYYRALRPFIPILGVSFISHYFFGERSIADAAVVALRIGILIGFSSVLTFTTPTGELVGVFYHILRRIPFVDAKGISTSMLVAVRFLPRFLSEAKGEGGIMERIRRLYNGALNYSSESVQEILDNFDEVVRMPGMGPSDAYTAGLALIFCAGVILV
ncbi:energy-coupling factor transporter transmembrane component T family protein [Limisalsivibrio acetivorans]|uniref:energy-coupling factor transporter transmembrane component T family protein n=1 Tax=Limisalsivibrio acetivorans TaxID=1304888 RepID=UPI0003B6CE54|nr:energy-coupling factor transporter transmembrane protein EcfT [Limisalsivibrio acetivorans]